MMTVRTAGSMILLLSTIAVTACSRPSVTADAAPTAKATTKTTAAPRSNTRVTVPKPAKHPPGRDIRVRYSITGSQKAAHVVYVGYAKQAGTSQYARVRLPWRQSFWGRKAEFVYVSGQNTAEGEWLACEIRVDGKVARRMRAEAENQVAVCSMNLPAK